MGDGRSPEHRSPIEGEVGVAREASRRVDPRIKYSHLKIKSKGGGDSSPSQSSSSLKRPHPADDIPTGTPSSFKIPRLLQDGAGLDKPMDPRDLFKGSGESGYDNVSAAAAPFGMFKSNFFSRSQSEGGGGGGGGGESKQPFGEITLGEVMKKEGESVSRGTAAREEREVSERANSVEKDSASVPREKVEEDVKSEVPSYLAHLDVGLGSDLKIDSAFGSLASEGGGGAAGEGGSGEGKEGEESQARKLPSMIW